MSEPWLDWQSMETAPKDGTPILLYTADLTPPTIQAQWRGWDGSWAEGGEWVDVWNNDPIEIGDGSPINPVRWARIPPPTDL